MSFRPSIPLGGQKARAMEVLRGFTGPASTAPQNAPEAGPPLE
jgi:hypothetical protein